MASFFGRMWNAPLQAFVTLLEWFEATCYHYADHIVPLTPAFGSYLERFSIPKHKLTIAPSGADPRLQINPPKSNIIGDRNLGLKNIQSSPTRAPSTKPTISLISSNKHSSAHNNTTNWLGSSPVMVAIKNKF